MSLSNLKIIDGYPNYTVVDGEVLPLYEGDINGGRNNLGANMAETEEFLYPSDYDTPEIDVVSERIQRIIDGIKAKGLPIGVAADLGIDDDRSDPYADLGGGIYTLRAGGISYQPRPRGNTTSRGPGYKTEAQRNARAHEAQARQARWGR